MGIIEGGLEYRNAGAPVNGTNEVQTLTIGGTPNGGTFKLKYEGQVTTAITWSATTNTLLANIQAALRALATIGSAGVTVTDSTLSSGIGNCLITFGGNLAKLAVSTITVDTNSLTGSVPTVAVAETTPGVTATARGAAVGASLTDTTNANEYINTGTALEPVWTLKDRSEESAASESTSGLVELATTAETITGTDDSRAVTPAGLAGAGLAPNVPISDAEFVVGSETGGNTINVAIQLEDALDADLAVRGNVWAYLSNDANGDSIATSAPSGGVAIGTDGLAIPIVAGKAFLLTSEVDGDIDLTIIEAGGATWYLIIVLPNGLLKASGAITFAP